MGPWQPKRDFQGTRISPIIPAQARSLSTQACSESAQACSLSAQVKAAAAHVERLKRKKCEKILGLSIGVYVGISAKSLPHRKKAIYGMVG